MGECNHSYSYKCEMCGLVDVTKISNGHYVKNYESFEGWNDDFIETSYTTEGGGYVSSNHPLLKSEKLICDYCMSKKYDPEAWSKEVNGIVKYWEQEIKKRRKFIDGYRDIPGMVITE